MLASRELARATRWVSRPRKASIGWGRTGTMFAGEQAAITPDILCTSKGLTGGWLALAVTHATDAIFRAHFSSNRTRRARSPSRQRWANVAIRNDEVGSRLEQDPDRRVEDDITLVVDKVADLGSARRP